MNSDRNKPSSGTEFISEGFIRSYKLLVILILGNLTIGAIGGWLTSASVGSWYRTIAKPAWTPPNGIFGPVWTTLYILIGAAAWQALRRSTPPLRGRLFQWYVLQLFLNLLWSFSFFTLRNPGLGLLNILALDAAAIICAAHLRRANTLALILFVPYVAWILFATLLNAAIWHLNA